MPSPFPNGADPSPHHHRFHSTVSETKLRRLNSLILLLRLASFCFALAAAVFMVTNSSRSPGSPSWIDSEPFRLVFAANAIVAVYSLFEMGASIWEILKGSTPLPEPMQLWFDFAHDQVFAYLAAAAGAAGAAEARGMRGSGACASESAFCVQGDIAVALGFAAFAFVALAALASGFRLVSFLVTGSRFPLS
ncbi:CASP-like protein 4C1 [Ananas comosus]|uniref:CASP-like protein n=1 Tax=Ananas comosus TaxID=4615 RepID=A0A199W6B1_ANACO|nr:CASP-like protein 4C1 [Ananas comosus]OAY84728.1 CASP-like protein 4C1 [Ananas comosus]